MPNKIQMTETLLISLDGRGIGEGEILRPDFIGTQNDKSKPEIATQ